MRRSYWYLSAFSFLTLAACGDSLTSSVKNGFPAASSVTADDCADVGPVFGENASSGGGYFFGDIVRIEPNLDRVRPNTHQRDVYTGNTYACSDYGLAALRITFSDVEASWDQSLRELEVLVPAESLSMLDTSPVIDPKTHALLWSTRQGSTAKFPGKGMRIGMPILGSQGGVYVGFFGNVAEIREGGALTLHYLGMCSRFQAEDFPTETSALDQLRSLKGADVIDFSNDFSWLVTSVCEDP